MTTCLYIILLFIIHVSADDSCLACRNIAKQFIIEFERTSEKTFVGGNSMWEKKNIGTYATSETRFHEILDKLCSKSSDKNCYMMLESLETSLESWWNTKSNFDHVEVEVMGKYLCVDNDHCCPYGYFGPNCLYCSPCFVNGGYCDGNGTRTGSGNCVCHDGYSGNTCSECKNDTHYQSVVSESGAYSCDKCHLSCLGGCKGPTTSDCVGCRQGWIMNSSLAACVDVNECASSPCASNQVCINTLGSYICENCHRSCIRCHGTTANDCDQCAKGYVISGDGKCEDIDECTEYDSICDNAVEKCRNMEGSYTCDCIAGHVKKEGVCVPERTTQDSATKHRRSVKSPKIIWTVSFLKEFLKYVGALLAFCVFYYLSRKSTILLCSGALLLGSYLYVHSTTLHNVFLRQR